MVYVGYVRDYVAGSALPLCFAVNDYQCQNGNGGTTHCCVDGVFKPDETAVWRFELSAAGERKMFKDGELLWSQSTVGHTLSRGTYSKLNVGRSGCCGTFPGAITDISVWTPSV